MGGVTVGGAGQRNQEFIFSTELGVASSFPVS